MTFTFTLIGHVDFGKSTLAGHLLYKCGVFTDEDVQEIKRKTKKDKWSYLLDIDSTERERGKTHEMSKNEFCYNGNKFCLIDTPGH